MPSTRRFASELSVDLSKIQGQGPHGRILRSDVQAAAGAAADRTEGAPGMEAALRCRDGASSSREPMTNLRRTIAENMRRSVALIPHATTTFRCDAGALLELREHCQQKLAHLPQDLPEQEQMAVFRALLDDAERHMTTWISERDSR